MTCIAASTDGKRIFMAGDSAGVCGIDLVQRKDEKVFKIANKFLIGFTSSFRMGQILRFNFKPPIHPKGMDTYEYMVTKFVESVKKVLRDGGYNEKKNDVDTGGQFLVGYKGKIFNIEEDYQVGESLHNYDSVGCGSYYALGYLYATQKYKNQLQRVINSIKCAETFSAGVRGPVTYCEL